MAKIRLVMAMTLDGFLPDENEPLMQWVKMNKRGFSYWRERSSFDLPVGYPMIDLICKKENKDNVSYLAEISNMFKIKLLHAILLYNIVDEWIIYYLPRTQGSGLRLVDKFTTGYWFLKSMHKYKNNICCMVYQKKPYDK